MARFCFTGNPFVDAGIAGMCSAAEVNSLEELDKEAVSEAVDELLRLMTSESTFKKRLIKKKETAFATSEMSVIFPNGPLSQSSYPTADRKRLEYKKRVLAKHEAFKQLAAGQQRQMGYGTCFIDGNPATMRIGNDEFPLVDSKSKRNFHPSLQAGHSVGALTALALEFFPLSVLRTGNNAGFFWFIHTAAEKIAIACATLTRGTMNQAIVRNEGLGFFGNWQIPSNNSDAALVALVRDLMMGAHQPAVSWKEINASEFPVTAYVFSNDNRGPNIQSHDLPHQLFWFFQVLRQHTAAIDRLNREVLQSEKIGWLAAKRMLARQSFVKVCFIDSDGDKPGRLRGGWQAHGDYGKVVLEMSSELIRDVEAVSQRIVENEDAKSLILMIQKEGPNASMLRLSRKNLATFDEYTRLVPPDDRNAAFANRDYLLAAIYERGSQGEDFRAWDGEGTPVGTDAQHPLIALTEELGRKLVGSSDLGKQVATDMAKAKRIANLRGAWLRAVRRGVLSWRDFVCLCPPDKTGVSFQLRDYLLAYLYSSMRDVDLPEPEVVAENNNSESQD
jgi:CRISPR-associated protein Cst1